MLGGDRGMLLQWKVFEPSLSEIQFVVPNTGISICIYTLHCNCTNTNATEKAQIKNDQINFGKKWGETIAPPPWLWRGGKSSIVHSVDTTSLMLIGSGFNYLHKFPTKLQFTL